MDTELAVALATTVLGGAGLYISREQARSDRETAIHDAFIAISNALIAYPELRPVFYEDEAEPADLGAILSESEAKWRANSVAELLLDTLELAMEQRHTWRQFERYAENAFSHSRFLRRWVDDHKDFYTSKLVELSRTHKAN